MTGCRFISSAINLSASLVPSISKGARIVRYIVPVTALQTAYRSVNDTTIIADLSFGAENVPAISNVNQKNNSR